MHTTSTFFNMFVTSVLTAAVQILQGPINRVLGLQIHVRIFLQHGRTNEASTGMKSQVCWKGKGTAPDQWIISPWNFLSHGVGIGKEVWLHPVGWCSPGTSQQSKNHDLVYLAYHWAQRSWKITGDHPSWMCTSRVSRKKISGCRLEIYN
jgi:hypothetical protein